MLLTIDKSRATWAIPLMNVLSNLIASNGNSLR